MCTIYPHSGDMIADIHRPDRVKVNDKTPDKQVTLVPGDRLTIGERQITLISAGNGS